MNEGGRRRGRVTARGLRRHLTLANVLSALALFFALGGGAYAITTARNSVTSHSIRNGAVKSADVGNNQLRGHDIRNKSLRARDIRNNSLRGRDIRNDSLTGADIDESSLQNLQVPSGSPAARVTFDKTQNTSIPSTCDNPTFSTANWNQEVFDTGGLHSAAHPAVLTAPVSGVYLVSATVEFNNGPAVDDGADATFFMDLDENGRNGDTIASTQVLSTLGESGNNLWDPIDLNASGVASLDKGDSVQVDVIQCAQDGISLPLNPGDSESSFQMVWMRPAPGSGSAASGPGAASQSVPTRTTAR